jgi:histidyl-tRNA synthetase
VEAFGSTEPSLDAEGIEMAGAFLAEIGLTDTRLALNSVGCPACRPAYREKLRAALAPRRAELCEDCHRRLDENPLRILDCKAGCRRLLEGAPVLLDTLDETCRVHFEAVRRCLDLLGVRHEVDPHLVRGLDYYVRTTFEIEGASLGAQNALLGGGRYDGLVEELGGPRVPGFGFACGLDRIVLSLAPGRGNAGDGVDLFLAVSGAEAFEKALVLAQALRRRGLAVERDSDPGKSLKAQTRRADALGARFVLYLGEQELRRNVYTLKRLASGEQSERSAEDLDRLVAEVARG